MQIEIQELSSQVKNLRLKNEELRDTNMELQGQLDQEQNKLANVLLEMDEIKQ